MDSNITVVKDFIEKHPFSAAQALDTLGDEDVAAFIQELSIQKGMKLLNLMNAGKATKCFLMLPTEKKKDLLEQSDEALVEALLRLVDVPIRERLLSMLSHDKAAIVKRRLEQTPNSVGVFMLPAITASKRKTAKEAIQIIKSNKEYLDSSIYVVNLEGELEGMVGLKELVLADKSETLGELMITHVPRFLSDTPIKNILDHPAWLEYSAIPVIDKSQRLLGSLPYLKTKEMVYKAARPQTKQVIKTGSELGELYLIGISGLLQAVGK